MSQALSLMLYKSKHGHFKKSNSVTQRAIPFEILRGDVLEARNKNMCGGASGKKWL